MYIYIYTVHNSIYVYMCTHLHSHKSEIHQGCHHCSLLDSFSKKCTYSSNRTLVSEHFRHLFGKAFWEYWAVKVFGLIYNIHNEIHVWDAAFLGEMKKKQVVGKQSRISILSTFLHPVDAPTIYIYKVGAHNST